RNGSSHLLQAVLAHGFGQNRIGLAERINAVDQVDIQFAYVHDELAHASKQRGIRFRLCATQIDRFATDQKLLGLLSEIQRGNSVLTSRIMLFRIYVRVTILDDLTHTYL